MNKREVVRILSHLSPDLTTPQVHRTIEGFLSIIESLLEQGEDVEIRGFGSWTVVVRKGRLVNRSDPGVLGLKSGTQYKQEDYKAVKFKPSPDMKRRVKGCGG